MKLKNLLAAALAALMTLSIASCGNGGGSTDKDGNIVLTFMGWEASPLETQAVQNGIKKFEEQNKGIKVKYTPTGSGDDYNAKLLSAMTGGSAPDVFFAASNAYRTYVQKNALMDITDKFNDEFPLDDFIESSRTIMEVDGKVYGISSCSVSPIIYYNKDIFDAAGVEYPSSDPANCWTIDEFRETAKKLTSDGVFGCYGLETVNDTLSAQLLSGGANKFNKDFTKSAINTPEAKKVLETIKAIREEDKSAPSAQTLDNAGMTAKQMLQTGKVAMLMDGSWSLQELSTMDFPIGIAPLPSYGKALTTGQAHLHCISSSTKNEDAAWKYLSFLSGMDYQGQLCKEGLWLPNRYSFWEEGPDGLDGWYDEERLGTDYLNMKEYLRDAEVDPSALQLVTICSDIITEETDKYFKEGQNIDTTLKNIEERSNTEIDAAIN